MNKKYFAVTLSSLIVGAALSGAVRADDEQTVGERLDDATVLATIKADLLKSRNVDGLDINVDVKDGMVTLSGQAESEAQRVKAEQIAKDAKGVKSVNNKITISK